MALDVLWLPLIFATLALAGIAQSRFFDAYLQRTGGPNRNERSRIFFFEFGTYRDLLKHPPFTLRSQVRRSDDPQVERLRRQYIGSVGLFLVAVIAKFANDVWG